MKKVYFLDTVHPILNERLQESGDYLCIDASEWTKDQCKVNMIDAFGLVIRSRFPMDGDFLKHFPDLDFIARSGAGITKYNSVQCS